MIKILVDTNVIIDVLAKRESFYEDSAKIFSLADLGRVKLVISALSIANVHYILYHVMKIKSASAILGKFKVLVELLPLNDKLLDLAISDTKFNDFEDSIQYFTALDAQCDLIITRNIKDFKNSTIPTLQPKEYLAKL